MTDTHYIALVCGAGLAALAKFGPEWIGLDPTIWIVAAWIICGVVSAAFARAGGGPIAMHEWLAIVVSAPVVLVRALLFVVRI